MSITELEESVAHFLHNLETFSSNFLAEMFYNDDVLLMYAIDEGYATVLSDNTDQYHVRHVQLGITTSGKKLLQHFL